MALFSSAVETMGDYSIGPFSSPKGQSADIAAGT
jgi:hypothetical protein